MSHSNTMFFLMLRLFIQFQFSFLGKVLIAKSGNDKPDTVYTIDQSNFLHRSYIIHITL